MTPDMLGCANNWISKMLQPVRSTADGQFDDSSEEQFEFLTAPLCPQGRREKIGLIATKGFSDDPSRDDTCNEGVHGYDVISGRGARTNSHAGNQYFRELCKRHRPIYINPGKKVKKIDVARIIVTMVQSQGGRFLRRDKVSGKWSSISDKEAMMKTCQALRDGFSPSKMKQGLK